MARITFALVLSIVLAVACGRLTEQPAKPFHLQEASIDDIHQAIRAGQVSCRQVVQAYLNRAKAYNGVCTRLITKDGAPVPAVEGPVRAGARRKFPTETVPVSSVVPNFDQYKGPPPDFGRMEPTMSDPSVYQQYGMVVGIPKAGQVNALETLNLRGERSVTCKAGCDAHPSTGALPAGCPAACEQFRRYPDVLERADDLDRQYGRTPDLETLPMYCIPLAFKAIYDAKDMRTTGGGDVNYAMDAPPRDSTTVARLREKGAIVYASAMNAEYNGGSGDPGGEKPQRAWLGSTSGSGPHDTWGGTACNPYDTEREPGISSAGSGASVSANLVVCSICESTGGSCRIPATGSGVVNFVPSKGLTPFGGAYGATPYADRMGIHCKHVRDAAIVLDALRDPKTGYFDPRDVYTALPRAIPAKTSYVSALVAPGTARPLAGMRLGVVREFMVKHAPSDAAISDGANKELAVLRQLGAELVESVDPQYPDDPAIPNMTFTFQDALAEVIPYHLPEFLSSKTPDGKPEFAMEGHDVTSRDYLTKASVHQAPWPPKLNLRRAFGGPTGLGPTPPVPGYGFGFQLAQYLLRRGDERIKDWASLNANAKYFSDFRRAAMKNWEKTPMDIRATDLTLAIKRREALRLVVLNVMHQNGIDLLVNPTLTTLPPKIGLAREPTVNDRSSFGTAHGAQLGIPEVHVPAGFADSIYDAQLELDRTKTSYQSVAGKTPIKTSNPMPFNIAFWGGIGDEQTILKVASAYEAATHHRRPPPDFGPVPGEP